MPGTPDNASPQTLLAFDFGHRRIGVAIGQCVTRSASPVGVAKNGPDGPDWERLERWIREWQPDLLVVGMPFNADGSHSTMTADVEAFIVELARYGVPIDTIDERYSSQEAEAGLRDARRQKRRGRVQKGAIDAAAAVLIAERWLRQVTG